MYINPIKTNSSWPAKWWSLFLGKEINCFCTLKPQNRKTISKQKLLFSIKKEASNGTCNTPTPKKGSLTDQHMLKYKQTESAFLTLSKADGVRGSIARVEKQGQPHPSRRWPCYAFYMGTIRDREDLLNSKTEIHCSAHPTLRDGGIQCKHCCLLESPKWSFRNEKSKSFVV